MRRRAFLLVLAAPAMAAITGGCKEKTGTGEKIPAPDNMAPPGQGTLGKKGRGTAVPPGATK